MGKVFKDKPINEITLRKFERPMNENKDELIRKFCISLGLLQPGDSRDIVVDILQVLLNNRHKKILMNSEEIREKVIASRKKQRLPVKGVASSNVRRQLKRLKDIYIVENLKNQYRITEHNELHIIFRKHIKDFYLKNILERVEDYFKEIK